VQFFLSLSLSLCNLAHVLFPAYYATEDTSIPTPSHTMSGANRMLLNLILDVEEGHLPNLALEKILVCNVNEASL
jgi:peptidoglycan biosynthesis protein MviN/MurJ (putative lipid II flippase)